MLRKFSRAEQGRAAVAKPARSSLDTTEPYDRSVSVCQLFSMHPPAVGRVGARGRGEDKGGGGGRGRSEGECEGKGWHNVRVKTEAKAEVYLRMRAAPRGVALREASAAASSPAITSLSFTPCIHPHLWVHTHTLICKLLLILHTLMRTSNSPSHNTIQYNPLAVQTHV